MKRAPRSNPVQKNDKTAAQKPRLEATEPSNHLILVSFRRSEDGNTVFGRVGNLEVTLPLKALEPFEVRSTGEDRLVCTIPLQEARALAGTKARST